MFGKILMAVQAVKFAVSAAKELSEMVEEIKSDKRESWHVNEKEAKEVIGIATEALVKSKTGPELQNMKFGLKKVINDVTYTTDEVLRR